MTAFGKVNVKTPTLHTKRKNMYPPEKLRVLWKMYPLHLPL